MDRATTNPVIGELAVAVESLKIEGAVALEFLGLHLGQEARKLVAD